MGRDVRRRHGRRRRQSRCTTARSTSPTRRCTSWPPSRTSASPTPTPSTRRSSTRRSALLQSQEALVGQYWSDYTVQAASLVDGTVLAGTTWQVVATSRQGDGAKIETVKPKEGATGWSDTWMLSSKAANPNCMKLWMDWISSPWANAQATEYFGEAPEQRQGLRARPPTLTTAPLPRRGRGLLDRRLVLDHRHRGVPRRPHRRDVRAVHRVGQRLERVPGIETTRAPAAGSCHAVFPARRARRQPFPSTPSPARAVGLLSPPVVWMLVVYIGSLVLLVFAALLQARPTFAKPTTELHNRQPHRRRSPTGRCFRSSCVRSLIAGARDSALPGVALPTAFFIAKIAPRWVRRGLIVSILLPLWAGLHRQDAMRGGRCCRRRAMRLPPTGRGGGGFMESVLGWTPGYGRAGVVMALTYLWLPYMVLPIYAGPRAAARLVARRRRRSRRAAACARSAR